MRIRDWSSDVCASDHVTRLLDDARARGGEVMTAEPRGGSVPLHIIRHASDDMLVMQEEVTGPILPLRNYARIEDAIAAIHRHAPRSEEHTSELQSLMRISYAVFCLKKKKPQDTTRAQ